MNISDSTPATAHFPLIAKCIAIAKGNLSQAAVLAAHAGCPHRVVEALKGAAGAVSTGDAAGSDFRVAVATFLDALRGASVFHRLMADNAFRTYPPRIRAALLAGPTSATLVTEGAAIPVQRPAFSLPVLEPVKLAAIIAGTEEMFGSPESTAVQWLSRELRGAIGGAADAYFLDRALAETGATVSASGSDPDTMRADILAALDAVAHPGGRLYWIAGQGALNTLAVYADVFPGAGASGGELAGLPLLASEGVTAGSLVLLDASCFAAWRGGLEVDVAKHATLELSDAPAGDSTTPTPAQLVSLWQANSIALRLTAEIAVERVEAAGVIEITDFGRVTG